jgi:hypothetical protein
VDSLAIYWEHSGSAKYSVQVWSSDVDTPSYNDKGWITVLTDTTLFYDQALDMCRSFLKIPATNTRYLRIRSFKRLSTSGYGCSIFELEAYGTAVPTMASPNSQLRQTNGGLIVSTAQAGVTLAIPGSRNFVCEIYSANGTLVRRLWSLTNSVSWNYRDETGSVVANGMFVARISAQGKTVQEKFAVCR